MLFGRRKDGVATPSSDAAQPIGDGVATESRSTLVVEQGPSTRELVRAIAAMNDDLKWMQERFEKLQNRVTTELREIRREVDRFFDEPQEE